MSSKTGQFSNKLLLSPISLVYFIFIYQQLKKVNEHVRALEIMNFTYWQAYQCRALPLLDFGNMHLLLAKPEDTGGFIESLRQ